MKPPLLALTLWPEWAYAITHLGKDVENRDWERLPTWLTGRYLAIHAGAHIGGRAAKVATKEGLDAVAFMARRAGLDVRVSPSKVVTSAIVAVVKVGKVGQVESPWAVPDAWQIGFDRVVVLREPVVCKGAQKLWTPDPEILERLRAQWLAATKQ